MSVSKHGPYHRPVENWIELDDSELRTRLIHRGVDPVQAKGWVRDREIGTAAEEITAALLPNEFDEAMEREKKEAKDTARAVINQM